MLSGFFLKEKPPFTRLAWAHELENHSNNKMVIAQKQCPYNSLRIFNHQPIFRTDSPLNQIRTA